MLTLNPFKSTKEGSNYYQFWSVWFDQGSNPRCTALHTKSFTYWAMQARCRLLMIFAILMDLDEATQNTGPYQRSTWTHRLCVSNFYGNNCTFQFHNIFSLFLTQTKWCDYSFESSQDDSNESSHNLIQLIFFSFFYSNRSAGKATWYSVKGAVNSHSSHFHQQ